MQIESIGTSEWRKEQTTGLLVVFASANKEKPSFDKVTDELVGKVLPSSAIDDFSGEEGDSLLFYPLLTSDTGCFPAQRVLLLGTGKASARNKKPDVYELFRTMGGNVAKVCRKRKIERLSVAVPGGKRFSVTDFVEYFIEGLLLGLYHFDKYKTKTKEPKKRRESSYRSPALLQFVVKRKLKTFRRAVKRGEAAATAAGIARDMANEPGNGWTPSKFAKFAIELADKREDVFCTVLEKKEMRKLGMGGILGVNQGSLEEPKLVIVDYCPARYQKTVMFVGKGLTFDSGGISLKPGAKMMDMKYDMCGGAAAIASMAAIIEEKPAVRVVCLVPSTDNMPGGRALKPGDIITHYGGLTSEIENTDAEGRLILADALAYGIKQFRPDCVIDLATLTGAVIIGLGHHYIGVLSNDDNLCEELMTAAARAGEKQWRLPLDELYAKQLESQIADIKNTGGRPAGTITAAEYLHKFVGKTPWVHLDIAGTAWNYTEKSYIPKGPSGVGTRTLIEFIRLKAAG